jgi:formylglycine-generating enzyme required for sulfatase activity
MKRLPCAIGVCAVLAHLLSCSQNPTALKGYSLPGLSMVRIPAGTFQMGSTNSYLYSTPVHSVTLSAFTMSSTLVTQAQYLAVMGTNPSYFDSGSTWPVDQVNWYDAALFCNKLSKLQGRDTIYTYTGIYSGSGYDTLVSVGIDYTKGGYRLPTEAEYEYACRAGTTTDYYWGENFTSFLQADTLTIGGNAVWLSNDIPYGTHQVATKRANAWGLYDMVGNLNEWCNDWYGNYSSSAQTNPSGPAKPTDLIGDRILRGGQWNNYDMDAYNAGILCSAYRIAFVPTTSLNYCGFRVVCGTR